MGMNGYNSSEEFRRHRSADVFIEEQRQQEATVVPEIDRLKGALDVYIDIHSTTKAVRELAKTSKGVEKYGADYQLDLSADIVLILEKIKSELR